MIWLSYPPPPLKGVCYKRPPSHVNTGMDLRVSLFFALYASAAQRTQAVEPPPPPRPPAAKHAHHDHDAGGHAFRGIEQMLTHKQLHAIEHGAQPLHGPTSQAAGTWWFVDAPGNLHGQAGRA